MVDPPLPTFAPVPTGLFRAPLDILSTFFLWAATFYSTPTLYGISRSSKLFIIIAAHLKNKILGETPTPCKLKQNLNANIDLNNQHTYTLWISPPSFFLPGGGGDEGWVV